MIQISLKHSYLAREGDILVDTCHWKKLTLVFGDSNIEEVNCLLNNIKTLLHRDRVNYIHIQHTHICTYMYMCIYTGPKQFWI